MRGERRRNAAALPVATAVRPRLPAPNPTRHAPDPSAPAPAHRLLGRTHRHGPPRDHQDTGNACIQRSARTFDARAQRTAALEQLPRPGLSERCELALLYVMAGRFAEGEALVREIMGRTRTTYGANHAARAIAAPVPAGSTQ